MTTLRRDLLVLGEVITYRCYFGPLARASFIDDPHRAQSLLMLAYSWVDLQTSQTTYMYQSDTGARSTSGFACAVHTFRSPIGRPVESTGLTPAVARRAPRQYLRGASKWIFATWITTTVGSIGALVKTAPTTVRFDRTLASLECCRRASPQSFGIKPVIRAMKIAFKSQPATANGWFFTERFSRSLIVFLFHFYAYWT